MISSNQGNAESLVFTGVQRFFHFLTQKGWVGVIPNSFIANVQRMLTVAECRKVLGKKFENYTDEQIEQLRDWLTKLARKNKRWIEKLKEKKNENSEKKA